MTSADEIEPYGQPVDLRIGTPERESARDALEEHLIAKRLDAAEHERRLAAVDGAATRAELMMLFRDLPPPHPVEPAPAAGSKPDEDMPPLAWAGCLTLVLGIPVAVVLGFVYGVWWTLAVPVVVPVVMAYVEHLRSGNRP